MTRTHRRTPVSTFTIGAATITRIEESYEPNFEATKFFAEWGGDVVARHREWMLPHHYDPASGKLKLSIHSWLVQRGRLQGQCETDRGGGTCRFRVRDTCRG